MHSPSHDGSVLHATRAPLALIIFVPICLVDDLFRDDLFNDIFIGRDELGGIHAVENEMVRTFQRDDTNCAAFLSWCVAQQ